MKPPLGSNGRVRAGKLELPVQPSPAIAPFGAAGVLPFPMPPHGVRGPRQPLGVPAQLFQFRRGEILDRLGRASTAQRFQQPRRDQHGNVMRFET